MFCCRRLTPLEQLAKSLKSENQQRQPQSVSPTQRMIDVLQMLYPMYTLPLKDVLELKEMKDHDKLMQEGMLVEFTDGMGNAIFVSHQWISPWHPDPELAQFQHLQGALKNIMSTSKTSIDLDPVIELTFPTARSISTEEFRSKALFIWYDYFSIPQINPSSWTLDDLRKPIEDALNSVAAYISRCHFFFVLQPVVEDPEKAELFGASTWASRGWCRLEKTVRELLPRNSYVVIRSATSFYVVTQASISFALAGPPGEGTFGRGEDKEKLCNVLTSLLKQLLLHHLIREDFLAYRSYLNLQSLFLRGFSVGSA